MEDRTLLNAGDLDPTFGTGGKVLTDFVGPIDATPAATVIQPDGKIVAAGSGTLSNNNLPYGDFLLARYSLDGSLDTAFGNGGRVNTEFFGYSQFQNGQMVNGLALGPDGKIVVVGLHQGSSTNLLFGIARYTVNGTLDPTFGSGGTIATVAGMPTGVVIQPDNKIIVVGNTMPSSGAVTAGVVVRFNSDGSLDSTFGTGGEIITPNTSAAGVALQIDGKIIVVGSAVNNSVFNSRPFIERYNPNGSPDAGFNTGALSTFGASANSVVLQTDGRILVTASSGGFLGQMPTPLLVRLNANGTLDTTFGSNGEVIAAVSTNGVALQSDGKIVVAGDVPQPASTSPANTTYAVARYNPDGSLDTTFGSGGTAAVAVSVAAVLVQGDGKIVSVGALAGMSGMTQYTDFALVRLNPSGTMDATFGAGGQVTTAFNGTVDSTARGIVIQADGKIIVAGGVGSDLALIRYDRDGSLDTTFGTGGKVTTDIGFGTALVFSQVGIALQADGKIVVAASTTLLRYNSNGSLDSTFGTTGMVTTAVGFDFVPVVQPDGKIVVLGTGGLTRYNPNGSLDTSFGQAGKVQIVNGLGLALQPDGKILVDNLTNTSALLTRYNSDGSPDTSFGTNGMVSISTGIGSGITFQSDAKIVIGSPVARFNADGSLDALFGMNGQGVRVTDSGPVMIAPNGDIVVVASSIAVYKPNGTLEVRFGNAGLITPDFAPGGFAIQPDGSIVVAGTTTLSGHTIFTVARYLTTGGTSLTPNQLFIAQVYSDLLQRPADPAGLTFWSGLLDGGLSRAQVVQKIQATQEYHTVLVNALYNRILGRDPDASGEVNWVNFLNQGGTEEQVEAFLLGSTEFFTKHGSDNSQGFLPALYPIVLERPIDASGLQSWGQALAGGMSRTAVAAAVLASLESDRLETQMLYAEFLHRLPDASGLDTYTNLLQQGVSNETVISILISSDEYFAAV